MLEGEPQRPLPAHARAEQGDPRRRGLPTLGDVRQHVVEHVPLGVSLGSNSGQMRSVHQLGPVIGADDPQAVPREQPGEDSLSFNRCRCTPCR